MGLGPLVGRQHLRNRNPEELGEPLQTRHREAALAPLVCPEHRRLELALRLALHVLEGQAALLS